ncbi:MAG: dipeptidyl-peptidase 3 family protein [Bacteroidales bacterium]
MKNFIITIIAIVMLMASCSKKDNHLNLNNTYYGSYFVMNNDNKMVENDIKVIINKDSIQLIENDSLVFASTFNTTSVKDSIKLQINEKTNFDLYYLENKNILLIKNYNNNNITLFTYSDLMKNKVAEYAVVKLKADIQHLSDKDKILLSKLFDIAPIMDELFWEQVCPQKDSLLNTITDEYAKQFFIINYGPYERLRNNKPFIEGVPPHSDKMTFYPPDMTVEEFEKWDNPDKTNWYSIIRRNEKGELISIPYSEFYKEKLSKAAQLLDEAALLSENKSFSNYLKEKAKSFRTNNYFDSDMAWMDVKDNTIDFIVGPTESYNDGLFGYKTSFESFILIKDIEWSKKLSRFLDLLPQIQESLPVDKVYKTEKPAKNNDLGVYEAVYYAGDCNAGSRTIAINLPNDKKVNEIKGSRKLQLKNIMKAKFDNILKPIAQEVIDSTQLKNINFDAFFENVMFHEVAHGLGISKTIKDHKLVTDVLKDTHTSLEEAKADIVGLYIVTWLYDNKQITEHDLLDNYVTFLAGIFRSVRFGVSSAHGKANMIEFNYLNEKGAFTYNEKTMKYTIKLDKMREAVASLANLILTIQGNGDYNGAKELLKNMAIIKPQLQQNLTKIANAGIPRDIVFEQNKNLLGIQ